MPRKRRFTRVAAAALAAELAVSVAAGLSGCRRAPEERSATRFLLDTVVTVTLYGGDESTLTECFDIVEKYDRLFGVAGGGDIEAVNSAEGEPVTVSGDTAELLRLSLDCCRRSGGAFDITLYPVKRLWDFTGEDPSLPDPGELETALSKVGYGNISLEGNTVTAAGGAKLDLGGIAKGWIAGKVAEYLEGEGVSALLNFGGSVMCVGEREEGWRVGVRRPFTKDGLAATLTIPGGAVATSGRYERCFTLDGTLYHHILDPATGYPVQNDLDAVTVVCSDPATADFLSTALFVMGYAAGAEFLETYEALAVFVGRDGCIRRAGSLPGVTVEVEG